MSSVPSATQWGLPTASKRALLIHGLTCSSQTWERVAQALVEAGILFPNLLLSTTLTDPRILRCGSKLIKSRLQTWHGLLCWEHGKGYPTLFRQHPLRHHYWPLLRGRHTCQITPLSSSALTHICHLGRPRAGTQP